MPRISRSYITDRLLPAVSIERLIGHYVTLKKSGSNYMCCCPFHHEKTPSFCVTPSKQMFYCFGCREHGNALDFIEKLKNLSFPDAVEELARFAGIPVEYEKGGSDQADKYREYYELMDRCAAFFSRTLFETQGAKGLEYFTSTRGLSKQTILSCRLGYAPAEWDVLRDRVCRNEAEYRKLIELGMVVQGQNGKTFSMYRDRVMIPIFDRRGRVISFGGRTMGNDTPKYMNTRESPIYRKRNELFGLYEALRDNNNRPERFVIVEGYMDVISVRQAGCTYAVASLGTATTEDQFRLMFRYSKKIVCCYDGDNAGRQAAWHALETVTPVLQDDYEIKFAFLPAQTKVDPDSLVREQGLGAFIRYLDDSMSYPEFLIEHTAREYDLSDPGRRSAFISDSLRRIKRIPLKPLQAVSLTLLSSPSGVDVAQLYDMLNDVQLPKPLGRKQQDSAEEYTLTTEDGKLPKSVLTTPMRTLIAFMLQQPLVVSMVYKDFAFETMLEYCRELQIKGTDELAFILEKIKEDPAITPAKFIEMVRETPREHYYRQLIDANMGLFGSATEGEISMTSRIGMLVKYIGMVLREPLQKRVSELIRKAASATEEELQEITILQKQLLSTRT
ncbi:MAG: DNA primase [Succinivibrio sp.]|nr:DNA primase [Succinivibrio sp.]